MVIRIDLVVVNGHIITMDPNHPSVEAMAISSGRIFAIGDAKELDSLSRQARQVINLRGRTVIPGFIDTHAHLEALGHQLLHLDLGGTTSIEDTLEKVQGRLVRTPPGEWIFGYNWDESNWSPARYPTKYDLDPIAPHNPVLLKRVCGHLFSANTLALQQLNFDFNHPGVDKDPQTGEAIGVFRDVPINIQGSQKADEATEQAILKACEYANSVGVTSVHENLSRQQFSALSTYLALHHAGKLTVRTYCNLENVFVDKLAGLRLSTGLGDAYFRLGGIKSFIDGSLGAQTAALTKSYTDYPNNKGLFLMTEEDYLFLLEIVNELGLQTSTHAIGDAAIDMLLRCHKEISGIKGVKRLRHSIIHAELLSKPLIKRVKKLGMLLLMQPNFVHRWGLPNGMYDARLGPKRAQHLNNFRLILDAGIRLAFGSDCMPMDPLYGIFSACTHPNPDTCITVEEALRCYTVDAAYASFEEEEKGSLSPGKLADFIVLSKNPLKVKPETLNKIIIEQTYLGGKQVYSGI